MKEKKLTFNLWLNIVLAIALILALVFYYAKIVAVSQTVFIALSFAGLLPVLANIAVSFKKKKMGIDFLALVALVFAFLAGEWRPAAFINLMLVFARIFSLWTEQRAKNIVELLFKYRPEKAKIERDGKVVEILVDEIKIGDLVVIEAGDRAPVDGPVISGQASLNESAITGESELSVKKAGDYVLSSSLNESGSLVIKAKKTGGESLVAKIIALVSQAIGKKGQKERLAGKFTFWYVFATLVLGAGLWFLWGSSDMVLSVLLVACADDIAVAIPLALTVAMVKTAQRGVLVKGGGAVENLADIKFFISDKTGTLTLGRPKVKEIKTAGSVSEKDFLVMAGSLASVSHHPVNQAIIRFLNHKQVGSLVPEEFNEIPGEGIAAKISGKKVFCGKIDFLSEQGVVMSESDLQTANDYYQKGFSLVGFARENEFLGFIALEDEIRPKTKEVIEATKKLGVKQWFVLTGDNRAAAQKVAGELGIKNFYAGLKPQDKLAVIEKIKKENKGVVAMMGDGVNDAAALALADVSVAMGKIGSDAAIETADIALMNDDLRKLPQAMSVAKSAVKIIKQNFWLWGVINSVGFVLVFAGVLHPQEAALYNFLSDFIPIANAFRVR
ncbi:MAG: cation-translocating P-type ATPase [Patescibacteria group bacterium]|nr:cation-translocating P-type ATPase [Patescibacteria group bacterium]